MKVYLSGGMRGDFDWQHHVMSQFRTIQFFNPRTHGLKYSDEYTFWDLTAIEKCDLLFAYLETGNPSGIGMAAEIGYAKGLGKKVIFCEEEGGREDGRYWHFIAEMSDVYCLSLEQGIDLLSTTARLYKDPQ